MSSQSFVRSLSGVFLWFRKPPGLVQHPTKTSALPMENEHHHFWGKLFPHHILHHPVLSDKGYSNIHQKKPLWDSVKRLTSKNPKKTWDSNPWRLGLDDYPLMESMGFQWDTLATIWNYNIFHLGNRKIMENFIFKIHLARGICEFPGGYPKIGANIFKSSIQSSSNRCQDRLVPWRGNLYITTPKTNMSH